MPFLVPPPGPHDKEACSPIGVTSRQELDVLSITRIKVHRSFSKKIDFLGLGSGPYTAICCAPYDERQKHGTAKNGQQKMAVSATDIHPALVIFPGRGLTSGPEEHPRFLWDSPEESREFLLSDSRAGWTSNHVTELVIINENEFVLCFMFYTRPPIDTENWSEISDNKPIPFM